MDQNHRPPSPRQPYLPDSSSGAVFAGATVVQLVSPSVDHGDVVLAPLHEADVVVDAHAVSAGGAGFDWRWEYGDLERVVHAGDATWTLFFVANVDGFGVELQQHDVAGFRALLEAAGVRAETVRTRPPAGSPIGGVPVPAPADESHGGGGPTTNGDGGTETGVPVAWSAPTLDTQVPLDAARAADETLPPSQAPVIVAGSEPARRRRRGRTIDRVEDIAGPVALTGIEARSISAWFGTHMVLDRVSLTMEAGEVTALIGPSGCGKSTFLRILNRMHEMIPSASMAGEVLLAGHDVYDPNRKLTDARSQIGMVFQKPNPFPAMSIYDNVLAALRVTGVKATTEVKDHLVQSCLQKAGLWNEVRDRLRQPGGGLSGGQQQRLCIARALAIRPQVLLMDEPCSALDPTSTRRIEETIGELVSEVTIVIVTHNMQQAARVSDQCAFFLAEQGTPGVIVEHGSTEAMFNRPQDPRTDDYVNGRFG